jgi:excisionase family DNA binding protein
MDIPNKSYKPCEVAEKLGCALDTVYRLIKYNQLEAFRVSGRAKYRIPDYALKDYLDRMRVRAEVFNGQE